MGVLKKLFIGDTIDLNWDFINKIPEFAKLKDCQQNPKWHSEGDAFKHTMKCLDAARSRVDLFAQTLSDKRILIAEVLFHDIGKAVTTEFKNGAWHAYGHEFAGEKITRRIMWDEPIDVRERVCAAVRYHMDVLRIADATHDLQKKLVIPAYNRFFLWSDVLFVKLCDVLGSEPENEDETQIGISKITYLQENTHSFGIYGERTLSDETYRAIVLGEKPTWLEKLKKPRPTVFVMIGLPGSGKNYYFEHSINYDVEMISRDDIRTELGYCAEGEKAVLSHEKEEEVSKVFDERFVSAIKSGKNVVLNNINLKRQYRDAYKKLLSDNKISNVDWVYIYIEAKDMETLLRRRPTINLAVYAKMIEGFDWPQPGEYSEFYISKSLQ